MERNPTGDSAITTEDEHELQVNDKAAITDSQITTEDEDEAQAMIDKSSLLRWNKANFVGGACRR